MIDRERVLDLLLSRATEGISDDQARELERGLRQYPDIDPSQFELAAALADVALAADEARNEPLPAELEQRILARAPGDRSAQSGARVVPLADRRERKRGRFDQSSFGWIAAAAILVLAAIGFWSTRPAPPVPDLLPSEQRAALIAQATDLIRVDWARPEIAEYAAVSGDVVWSNERQSGFMRLRGLPANRITAEQYQLWIVDPSRDSHPIDGGVFDIPAGSDEVIVPIDAKLRVDDPTVFAITLEQPGGVVVSDGPLLVLAPVPA